MKSGITVAKQIRSIALICENFRKGIEKIMAQTVSTDPADRQMEAIRSEVSHLENMIQKHLTEEPIQLLDIAKTPLDSERKVLEISDEHENSKDSPISPQHPVGSIVVVDDEPSFNTALIQQFRKDGYQCIEFSSGREALLHMASHPCQMLLLDVCMPETSGKDTLEQIKNSESLRDIPVIMTAQRHELDHIAGSIHGGAEDFLAKPYNLTIVRARVASSIHRNQLRELEQCKFKALVKSQQQLAAELTEAAEYVTSLLPKKLHAPVATDWRYIPSSQLGGDSFGYHWIDVDHLAIYLLDVCGHGVGAALLSVSILNFLRSGTLMAAEARQPTSVLDRLNTTFLMERHNDMYFSLWYGVYNARRKELEYSSGGHPPAILITPDGACQKLAVGGTVIGAISPLVYKSDRINIPPGSRLYVFSDGTYEIDRPNAPMMGYDEFAVLLDNNTPNHGLESLLAALKEQHAITEFDDDISLIEFRFLQVAPTFRETLRLQNSMDEWSKLLRFTEEFTFHHGISREDQMRIDVILEEVVTNVLKYGGITNNAEACTIELILEDIQLTIRVSDLGNPFNPLLLAEVDAKKGIKDRPIGGLGIHFVKKLTHSQHYEYSDHKNILTLITELSS